MCKKSFEQTSYLKFHKLNNLSHIDTFDSELVSSVNHCMMMLDDISNIMCMELCVLNFCIIRMLI